jgi:hypothetical protein
MGRVARVTQAATGLRGYASFESAGERADDLAVHYSGLAWAAHCPLICPLIAH